ncbi:MAG: hypothetical protein CML14_10265 [Puniceicoccaceae bacterium]|nr:hypothetical protein [Puniceicoccaceae bacterium]
MYFQYNFFCPSIKIIILAQLYRFLLIEPRGISSFPWKVCISLYALFYTCTAQAVVPNLSSGSSSTVTSNLASLNVTVNTYDGSDFPS